MNKKFIVTTTLVFVSYGALYALNTDSLRQVAIEEYRAEEEYKRFVKDSLKMAEKEVDKEVKTSEKENTKRGERVPVTPTDDYKFRLGGYGEMLAKFMNYSKNRFSGLSSGTEKERRASVSIPRFVLAAGYKFNKVWSMDAEIEFESGGTGTAVELENSENGEYEVEIEKGGEVAIEQFHIDANIHRSFKVSAGHVILPIGLTNAHHEPINFFGTSRPEGETKILPSTWHETGIAFSGTFGKNYATFNYQAMVTTGLNANGFDRDTWVASGKQGLFEVDNFKSPAYIARVDYVGIKGLRIGGSFYYCNDAAANADKSQTYSSLDGKASVKIFSIDGQYKCRFMTARFNILHGTLDQSSALSKRNVKLSNKSPYSRLTPIAKNAVSYGGELGINIKGFGNPQKGPSLFPFVRYEYYNSQKNGEKDQVMDNRCETSMWTAGLDWYALPNLVVKADYTWRKIGGGMYNNENEFAIGLAYIGWWCKN